MALTINHQTNDISATSGLVTIDGNNIISVSNWEVKTSNHTIASKEHVVADTSGGSFTITLPLSPSAGDFVQIADGDDWSANNLTVERNVTSGETIEGLSEDLVCDLKGVLVTLIYDSVTWEVYVAGALVGGGTSVSISDDTSTDATRYIGFTDTTSGTAENLYVSSTKLYYNPSTGTLNATNFNSLSDETLKENIQPIEHPFSVLDNINTVSYTWKDTGVKSYGVIAQELEQILPEAIEQVDSFKSVSYNQLLAHTMAAVKELKARVECLENSNGKSK